MNYQRVYDIHLLDDLHNYFPAVLYEPDRFLSVGQLLSYVRSQARSHFDIFSRESRAHMNTVNPPGQHVHNGRRAPSVPVRPPPISTAAPRSAAPPLSPTPYSEYIRTYPVQVRYTNPGEDLIQQLINPQNNLESLLHEALHVVFPQNLESVIVSPSQEQIAAATVIQRVTAENEMCPICQDSVEVGANVRHLTACGHRFHTGCIDTWFTRNVHCPVCRHDIRETDPVPSATAPRQ